MKKKGIILLITLFFISAISILILQNLDDSETFINEISYDTKLTQFKITNKNVQDEIITIVNENKDYIDEVLENTQSIPLAFGNVNLVITLDYLDDEKCNINKIKNQQDIFFCDEELSYNISDKYTFIEKLNMIKKDGNISSKLQLDYFINDYKQSVNDDQIDSVKDQFTYISRDNNATYLECNYDIFLENDVSAKSNFVFKLGDSKIITSTFVLE